MEILNQQQIWNKIAKRWQEYRKEQYPDYLEFIKKQKGKILDVGCGSGRNFIRAENLEFYGVDFSREMLEYAKQKNIAKELKQSPVEKLPYQDEFFDSAIFISALHCIETKEKRKKSLQELFRVLKPNSQAMISVWSRSQKRIKNKPKESEIPWTIKGKKYLRYYYIYEKKELEDLLKKVGFKIIKTWEDKNLCIIIQKTKSL